MIQSFKYGQSCFWKNKKRLDKQELYIKLKNLVIIKWPKTFKWWFVEIGYIEWIINQKSTLEQLKLEAKI